MEKNTVIGWSLIAVVLIGWFVWTMPSQEQLEREQAIRDSIAQVEQEAEAAAKRFEAEQQQQQTIEADDQQMAAINVAQGDSSLNLDSLQAVRDSLERVRLSSQYGRFASASVPPANADPIVIENERMRLTVSRLGGRLLQAELKQFSTYDSMPLILFDADSSNFDLAFQAPEGYFHTNELYFEPSNAGFGISGEETGELAMRLYADGNRDEYVEIAYGMTGTEYMVDYAIRVVGMDDVLRKTGNEFDLDWNLSAPAKEKGTKMERNTTGIYWRYANDDPTWLSEQSGDDDDKLLAPIQWLSFKQQFFSVTLIADQPMDHGSGSANVSQVATTSGNYTKHMNVSKVGIPLTGEDNNAFTGRLFIGPNGYDLLSSYDLGLEEQLNLGWPVIRHISMWVVIPLFNWLESYGLGYGIIILLLTLIIKMILFPITWRNFRSSAKMRVLKPDIDEINEKYKDKDAMAKQQATMALYKKAGVSPFSGCIPMLLQMPILYAMFRFFPTSLELRGESFLWADDLSSYDAILTWTTEIPLISTYYGNHMSLFTILMAISTFLYTRYNMQTSAGPQMAQMKVVTYMMPFMLLIFFNSYAAGLSYYYFLSNLISILQHVVIKKWFINEEAIRAKINENKKKPQKKSRFAKRLEDMQRQQQPGRGKKRK